MTDKVYLDASFLIATQVSNHIFHQEAVRKLARMKKTTPVLSLFAVGETIYILRKLNVSKEQIVAMFKKNICSLDQLEVVSDGDGVEHISQYLDFWEKEQFKPTDAIHLFLMRSRGIKKLATFDADFIDREKELGIKMI